MAKRHFWGTNGNDRISGTKHADIMSGLRGNDTYVLNNRGDIVLENSKSGLDTIRTFVSIKIPQNVERVFVIGDPKDMGYDVSIAGNNQNNYVSGNCSNNYINGQRGNDTLYGGKGNDIVQSGSGNDSIGGGFGKDYLYDTSGNDKYYYNRGEGKDIIHDYSGYDRLVFNDINSYEVNFYKSGSDLTIDMKRSSGEVTIDNYFVSQHGHHPYAIEAINFDNEVSLNFNEISHLIHH